MYILLHLWEIQNKWGREHILPHTILIQLVLIQKSYSKYICVYVYIFIYTHIFLINTLKVTKCILIPLPLLPHQSFNVVWIVFSLCFSHLCDLSNCTLEDVRGKLGLIYTLCISYPLHHLFHHYLKLHTSCSSLCRLFQLLVLYISISSGWDCL